MIGPLHPDLNDEWHFHFSECRGGPLLSWLQVSYNGSLPPRRVSKATPPAPHTPSGIPFQINLDSSAFINLAHGEGFIPSSRERKDMGAKCESIKDCSAVFCALCACVRVWLRKSWGDCLNVAAAHLFDCSFFFCDRFFFFFLFCTRFAGVH